ncbi:MAG: GNAT family N-acetyltransferase [Pseudomonadota bacterium]
MTEPTPQLTVRRADWDADRDALRAVRFTVFVQEQDVPEDLEWDGEDADCHHALAFLDERVVGTGRLTPDGRIGRMAVLKEARGHGVGAAVLDFLVDVARQSGQDEVQLHAQSHALAFYERAGFTAYGEPFDEAGIEHRHMVRRFVKS